MAVQVNNELLRGIPFFHGLDESELAQITNICEERSFEVNEICQVEGEMTNHVSFIIRGRVGALVRISSANYSNGEIIMDTLRDGDVFGWSSLIRNTPWSTLKVLEPTRVIYVSTEALLHLCESNTHIGYVLMKNLASTIASRLKRNRISTLNAIVAIKGV